MSSREAPTGVALRGADDKKQRGSVATNKLYHLAVRLEILTGHVLLVLIQQLLAGSADGFSFCIEMTRSSFWRRSAFSGERKGRPGS